MTFRELSVGQKFRCFNRVSGAVDRSLPAYTKRTPGLYKPGQPYNATHLYGRKLERTAWVQISDDTQVELAD